MSTITFLNWPENFDRIKEATNGTGSGRWKRAKEGRKKTEETRDSQRVVREKVIRLHLWDTEEEVRLETAAGDEKAS